MTLVRNPFDAGGYSLAEMTQAINILPNLYTRLAQIGLFRFEGVSQRSVIIEQYEGVLSLLPSVPLGGPATVGTREGRSMRSFALPWIPHDDVILPADIQGMPALGLSDAADPLVEVMNRKLLLMRRKHAQTREYMEMNALRGIVKDGAGTTLYNYFTEFGLAQISVDFVLGTAGTNVQGKVREVCLIICRSVCMPYRNPLSLPPRTAMVSEANTSSVYSSCANRASTHSNMTVPFIAAGAPAPTPASRAFSAALAPASASSVAVSTRRVRTATPQ